MSNLNTRSFLDAVAGYANSTPNGPQPSNNRPIRLATVDPYYTTGMARVIFDGESETTAKGYAWASTYDPSPGDRVFLIPVGQSYLIGGLISSSRQFNRFIKLDLLNGWVNYNGGYHEASVTKSDTGVVKLSGLIRNGTDYATMAVLPVPFRPLVTHVFLCVASGNNVASLTVRPDGTLKGYAGVLNGYMSLENITYQTNLDLTWTDISVAGYGVPSHADGEAWAPAYTKDTLNRVWLRGALTKEPRATTNLNPFTLPSGYRPSAGKIIQGVNVGNKVFGAHYISDTGVYTITEPVSDTTALGYSLDDSMFPSSGYAGTWTDATLLNAWVSYSTAYDNAGYTKDADGMVHLRGLIKSGTATANTTLFNLPAGYRPGGTLIRLTSSNNTGARVDIYSNGDVKIAAGSNVWLNLNGICFFPEA